MYHFVKFHKTWYLKPESVIGQNLKNVNGI